MGFPWSNLALTQSNYIYFIQFIEVTGTYGVSFVIIGFNIILYNVTQKKISLLKDCLLFRFFNWIIHCRSRKNFVLAKIEQDIRVAVVQPNVNPNTKWQNKKEIIAFMDSLTKNPLNLNQI